jgi:hypothetical protein
VFIILKVPRNIFVSVTLVESVKIMDIMTSYSELESTIFACITGLDAIYADNNLLLRS